MFLRMLLVQYSACPPKTIDLVRVMAEGIESNSDDWYAVGVQWHPGSGTASGLDIQVFRGLVDAARHRAASKVMVKLAA